MNAANLSVIALGAICKKTMVHWWPALSGTTLSLSLSLSPSIYLSIYLYPFILPREVGVESALEPLAQQEVDEEVTGGCRQVVQ